MSQRDWLHSHFLLVLGGLIVLPGIVWGLVVLRGRSQSVAPVKASPAEQVRFFWNETKRLFPWEEGWKFYTTRGGEADLLNISFSYPPKGRVEVLGPTRVAVDVPEASEPLIVVGDRALALFRREEILHERTTVLHGHRLRLLRVKRKEAPEGFPLWWTQEHDVAVIDRDEQARIFVAFSPKFTQQQRFLDGTTW